MQEIQEALDERQNNIDSLLANNQVNNTPFAFESQIDTDTYPINLSLKSTDESFETRTINQTETSQLNETIPLLPPPNEKENREKTNWMLRKDLTNIKKEPITPPKPKRRQSKTPSKSKHKNLSSTSSMRQMTMTQLFDPIESPRSTTDSSLIKQEPNTPSDDTMMFMPESLIGLAQPSDSTFNHETDQNDSSDQISIFVKNNSSPRQSLKRKAISSPIRNDDPPDEITTTDDEEEENVQNEAILQTPSSFSNENEELLYACPMCRNYWLGLPEELRNKQGLKCRHRQRPIVRTPEHFWSLGIPNTQTCIQRGYGGVLPPDKPIERPRRPRRQHQRKLQEQQQPDIIDDDDDEE